jgi:histidinol-phosphate phosphatase family protein
MEWHLRLLKSSEISEALVVAGHLGDQVQQLCDELPSSQITTRVIHEEEQRGTVAALRLAAESTEADEFVVVLGDILMSFPLDHVLQRWRATCRDIAIIVHPSTHPSDSDAAFPRHDGSVLVVPKSQPRDHVPNMSSTGMFLVNRQGLERYGYLRDLGSNVLPAAAQEDNLAAIISSHYFKDTGTPTRLEAARRDVESGAFTRRGGTAPRPCLFLDRDGVINPTDREYYSPEKYELLPGVAQAVRTANLHGLPVIVLTNQPHLAKGLMSFEDHDRVRARMDALLAEEGAFVDDYLFCPHHPEAGFEGEVPGLKVPCDCRKPAPGLAHRAAERHGLDLSTSVMVGDTDRDRQLAAATGMSYLHVGEPPTGGDTEDCYPKSAEAIRRGIEVLTC